MKKLTKLKIQGGKAAISDYEEMQCIKKQTKKEKEVVRLNKLQKIQSNVARTEKTKILSLVVYLKKKLEN